MSDTTTYDSAALQQLAADLRLAYRGISDELDDLEKSLESKLAMWDGEARGAYTDAKRQWDQKTVELNTILQQIGAAVENTNENYTRTEKDNTSMFMD